MHAAVAREGSTFVGRDAGEIAGLGPIGVEITSDPLQAFLHAEGVIDFTSPATSVTFAGLAAQARIVHIVGTTGCSAEDEEKFKAASRHARIVAPNAPGYFLSDPFVADAPRAEDYADAAAAFLDARGIEGKVHVVGSSFGAMTAAGQSNAHVVDAAGQPAGALALDTIIAAMVTPTSHDEAQRAA